MFIKKNTDVLKRIKSFNKLKPKFTRKESTANLSVKSNCGEATEDAIQEKVYPNACPHSQEACYRCIILFQVERNKHIKEAKFNKMISSKKISPSCLNIKMPSEKLLNIKRIGRAESCESTENDDLLTKTTRVSLSRKVKSRHSDTNTVFQVQRPKPMTRAQSRKSFKYFERRNTLDRKRKTNFDNKLISLCKLAKTNKLVSLITARKPVKPISTHLNMIFPKLKNSKTIAKLLSTRNVKQN